MLERLERRVVARGIRQVKYVEVVPVEDATGLVAAVYEQLARDMQILPPAVLHSSVPELLAGAWCMLRETLIVGEVPRLVKEAVAIGVSQANVCPYCVEAHSLCLPETPAELPELLPGFSASDLVAVARWASRASAKEGEVPLGSVFFQLDTSEVLGTAVAFHYFNRMVNVFLESSPISLPSALRWMEGMIRHLGREMGKRLASVSARPGDSLELLAPGTLPEDLRWAGANPRVAGALGRMARVTDSLALELIPDEVRTVVATRVARWNGERCGIDRSWVENATRGALHSMDRPLAALLLLTALASHQVDARLIRDVRKTCPDPHDWSRYLVAVVGWAAFTAARRVGTWLDSYRQIAASVSAANPNPVGTHAPDGCSFRVRRGATHGSS